MKPFLGRWHRFLRLQDTCHSCPVRSNEESPGKLDSPILPVLLVLEIMVEPVVLSCCIPEFLTLVYSNTDFQLFMTVWGNWSPRWAKGLQRPPSSHLLCYVQARMSWAGEILEQAAHTKA